MLSQRLSIWNLPALLGLNIATVFVYAFDKSAAELGRWRTAESTLHFLALAGGWPAAWLAQQVLRHKTSKESFRAAYWTSAVMHCVFLGIWVFGFHAKLATYLS